MRLPEYDDLDATALAAMVQAGEVSPGELVEAAIERIEARNPAINAVVHRSYERARAQAADPALPQGPFRGVPFLLKDLKADDAGQPSTSASALLRQHKPGHDSELVARFKRAGLIVCGRTNTPEFGILGVTEPALYGPTRNPWDHGRTCGGSSGGSGAAVAARMTPLAHGGDGGGSIRIPASHCGLVGLKPTRGRVPLPPVQGRWADFVVEHVLARSVRDSAGILDCIAGPALGDAHTAVPPTGPYAQAITRPPGKLRIAFCRDALFAEGISEECQAAVDQAVALAQDLGHELVEAKPRFDRAAMVRAYLTVVAGNVAAGVRAAEALVGHRARSGELEDGTWLLRTIGESLSAADYIEQLAVIEREAVEVARFFENHDVLLTATVARPPVEIGELAPKPAELMAVRALRRAPIKAVLMKVLDQLAQTSLTPVPNTQLFNMTGQPAISLPLYWTEGGLPIGTQWAARTGAEDLLLQLAATLEQARPWAERKPPGPV
ncbi:MAG: amidase [Myxococcales bacterium]|nr:amidase [Myxococcales bacterium]